MGRAKKNALKKHSIKPHARPSKAKFDITNSINKKKSVQGSNRPPSPSSSVPFQPADRILLVGEGDFSFARSLLDTHKCVSVLATSFDAQPIVLAKYPQAASNIEALEAARENGSHVMFEVDATKIGKGRIGSGGKRIKTARFGRIVFNFPHVGGLTKDVSRQIRHNQELLLGFFKAALPLLTLDGTVIVTVFEGEPYDTWDLKGLAKTAGLKSRRSFRFQHDAYPEYRHARTLGNIEGGGGWKGEERPARTYVLERDDRTKMKERKETKASEGATGANTQPVNNMRDEHGKKRKRQETDLDND